MKKKKLLLKPYLVGEEQPPRHLDGDGESSSRRRGRRSVFVVAVARSPARLRKRPHHFSLFLFFLREKGSK